MSHFTCLVIGPDYEGQLAPYDENIPVEPYKAYWDSDEISRWEEILQRSESVTKNEPEGPEVVVHFPPDQVIGAEYTLEEMRDAYIARYESSEDGPEVDDGGIFFWSTYNPKSRWDWYELGGRWESFFKLKANGTVKKTLFGGLARSPERRADQVLKSEVDADAMRDAAGQRAARNWDRVQEAFGSLPEALGWDTHYTGLIALHDAGEEDGMSIEEARKSYNQQPRVVALKKLNETLPDEEKVLGWLGPNIEEFQISREEFVQRARDEVLCTYAYVMNGEWHAPGKVGWFGMSTESVADRVRFAREFNELFDSLPDDTELTLVDCHI